MNHAVRRNAAWREIIVAGAHWPSLRTVLVAAALLRLATIPLVGSFRHPVTWEFGPLATNIATGHGYSDLGIITPFGTVNQNGGYVPSIFMPPAYSYVLAFFYRLAGPGPVAYLALEVVQAALGVILVFVVYRLALILLGKRGAIAAACLTAIYPAQVYMCNEFHPISIYIVLGTATVLFLVRYIEMTRSWKDLILAGVCGGILMLFRGEAPALVLLYAIILILRGGRKTAGAAAAFLLTAFAFLAPWTIRNYREFGIIIPVCASGGVNLWVGNNPRATGGQHYILYPKPLSADLEKVFDQPMDKYYTVRVDAGLKRLAIDYIRTHPREDTILAAKKLFIFWLFDPTHDKGSSPAYWVPSLILSFFAAWGAVLRGKKLFTDDLFLSASVLFALAIGMVVFVLPRYKIVIDPFLIVIAANAVVTVAARIKESFALTRPSVREVQTEMPGLA